MNLDDLTKHHDTCRSCRARIVWANTNNDKPMPVNAAPAASGNVLLAEVGGRLLATVLGRGQAAGARDHGVPLFLSHFKDCPNADLHRRR